MTEVIRIVESTKSYVAAEIEVEAEELARLRAMAPAEVKAWADQQQAERDDLEWEGDGTGEDYETEYVEDGYKTFKCLWNRDYDDQVEAFSESAAKEDQRNAYLAETRPVSVALGWTTTIVIAEMDGIWGYGLTAAGKDAPEALRGLKAAFYAARKCDPSRGLHEWDTFNEAAVYFGVSLVEVKLGTGFFTGMGGDDAVYLDPADYGIK